MNTFLPTIYVISDSVGITAKTLARAAASQFGETDPHIELLSEVRSFDEVRTFLNHHRVLHRRIHGISNMLLFYTLVEKDLIRQLNEYLELAPEIVAVDLMSDAIDAIAKVSNMAPRAIPGGVHATNERYFQRISALEFTLAHDDGLLPQDLTQAEIVIIGVSRTSKTPTSIYLGLEGYRVANIPLIAHMKPPEELFLVDRTRIFGLITSESTLVDIRRRRIGPDMLGDSAYANIEAVREELREARALMNRLGCTIINTQNRAIEETAREIMRFYDADHPQVNASYY
ncbi:MAG: kinase/pyrophosphorylase [Coriobacteriales bacterium]|nr:kinase/pyrophosphorylase [Coriobacteriales bacterium]